MIASLFGVELQPQRCAAAAHWSLGRLSYLYQNFGPQLAVFGYRLQGTLQSVIRWGSNSHYDHDGTERQTVRFRPESVVRTVRCQRAELPS